jgi:hypothetical protein
MAPVWERLPQDLDSPTSADAEYQPFLKSEDNGSSEDRDSTAAAAAPRRSSPSRQPWIISTLILACTTIALATLQILSVTQARDNACPNVCLRQSDTVDARGAVEYEQRTWTGALTFDNDLDRIVRLKDAPVEYVGEPSKEIDDAWDDLLRSAYPHPCRPLP